MAKDIFGRRMDSFGGAFTSDHATITFPGVTGLANAVGLLIQQVQVGYNRQLSRLYELNSRAFYYVAGRPMGQGTIGRIVGPTPLQAAFYEKYGDVCQAGTNSMQLNIFAGCDEAILSKRASMHFTVINAFAMTISAEQAMINETATLTFSNYTEHTN